MKTTAMAAAAALFAFPAAAVEVAVDLSGWTAEGGGNWNVQAGNDSVFQSQNGNPGVFVGPAAARGTALKGTLEIGSSSGDDDFVGFVLGYDSGEIGSGPTEFMLVDWKGQEQAGYDAGLAISLVTGPVNGTSTGDDYWQHTGVVSPSIRSNAAGALYEDVGWAYNTEYEFDLEFYASSIRVFVDGNLELDVAPSDFGLSSFADGSFGFYNFSQSAVTYAGITEEVLPPDPSTVPLPATLPMIGFALGALGFVARRRG